MKRKTSLLLAAMMTATIVGSMTGCGAGKLKIKWESESGFAVSPIAALNDGGDYTAVSSSYGSSCVVVYEENSDKYYIVDLETGAKSQGQKEKISCLDGDLFYTYANDSYALYNKTDYYRSFYNASIDGGVLYSRYGERIYRGVNGLAVEEDATTEILRESVAFKVGDYYLSVGGDYNYHIFNKKGKYKRSMIYGVDLEIAADEEVGAMWNVGNKVFMQTTRTLPEDATKYTYVEDGEKVEVNTYRYNVATGNMKHLKNFGYLVDSAVQYGGTLRCAILSVMPIKDKKLIDIEYIQAFNENGGIYKNLQKLVPGASEIDVAGDYIAIKDLFNKTTVFKGNKKVLVVKGDVTLCGNYAYQEKDDSIIFYDLKKGKLFKAVNGVEEVMTFEGTDRVAYLKDGELSIFNGSTGVIYSADCDSLNKKSMYYEVLDGTVKNLVFPLGSTTLRGVKSASTIVSGYNRNATYELLKVEKETGTPTYYTMKRTYRSV